MKAPLGVFSAGWLASTFDLDVVILIRHPAAVAHSYKRLQWRHPFSDFLRQPKLMEEHLSSFAPQIERYARTEQNLVDQETKSQEIKAQEAVVAEVRGRLDEIRALGVDAGQ